MTHLGPLLLPKLKVPWPGHDAVIVFFVLSGYVIARAVERGDPTLRDYTISRLSRLWSVVVPAVILCLVVVLMAGNPPTDGFPPAMLALWNIGAYPDWNDLLYRSVTNILFLGQIWNAEVAMPLDNPFWSLNFEVGYYAIFGAAFYLSGVGRMLAVVTLCVIAGPKILLLMPCWLFGVALYRCRWHLAQRQAIILFVASVLLYGAAFAFSLKRLLGGAADLIVPFASTNHPELLAHLADYLTALIVALNFLAAAHLVVSRPVPITISKSIRGAASYTLSIYLYHVPLGILVWLLLGQQGILGLVTVSALIVLLGSMTELKRADFRKIMQRIDWVPSALLHPAGKVAAWTAVLVLVADTR